MQQITFCLDLAKDLQNILDGVQSKRYLLVCDDAFPFLAVKDEFVHIWQKAISFSDFTPNPQYEDVCKGVKRFQKEHCDAIVAIGGGSALDVAKCIKLFCKLNPVENYLRQEYFDSDVPLIAIPTTAGTGSESTRYAVIYFEGKKQSVTHESIIPNYALLVPTVLKTLPLYQKKCTLLDALCQGIESWWSVNSTKDSLKLSREAVALIVAHMDDYLYKDTESSAEYIMKAANLAGQAISITQTTSAHAMSYKLSSLYGLPHGHAVALCLPQVWRYMMVNSERCIDSRGEAYLLQIFRDIANIMECQDTEAAIQRFETLINKMEIQSPVSTNREVEIGILVDSVDPTRLSNNPVKMDKKAFYSIYKRIVK